MQFCLPADTGGQTRQLPKHSVNKVAGASLCIIPGPFCPVTHKNWLFVSLGYPCVCFLLYLCISASSSITQRLVHDLYSVIIIGFHSWNEHYMVSAKHPRLRTEKCHLSIQGKGRVEKHVKGVSAHLTCFKQTWKDLGSQ